MNMPVRLSFSPMRSVNAPSRIGTVAQTAPVLDETLVERQRNGVSKTSACQNALVVDFNEAPSASVIILVPNGSQLAVPGKPGKKRHDHTRKSRSEPWQRTDDLATPSKTSPAQMNTASGKAHSVNPGRFKARVQSTLRVCT